MGEFASNRAAALAADLGLDAAELSGTSAHGKVTVEDVRRAAAAARGAQDAPPAGLGEAGRALWSAIVGDMPEAWELDARERHFLERACRTEDELRALEREVDRLGPTVTGSRGQVSVNPALSEARQLRLVQIRLLANLELSPPDDEQASASPVTLLKRRAAQARWSRKDRVEALRRAKGVGNG